MGAKKIAHLLIELPFSGLVDCLNDEDCVGADRLCHRNKTMTVGTCICRNGFRAALENPIKCLNDGKSTWSRVFLSLLCVF
jgi:hypothetical protein